MHKSNQNEIYSFFNQEFAYIENNLDIFLFRPYRLDGGFTLFCVSGKAIIRLGVLERKIVQYSEFIVLPGSTISVISASEDFSARVFVFSKGLFENAALRLGNSLTLYLRDSPPYLHEEDSILLQNTMIIFDYAKIVSNERDNKFIRLMQLNFLQSYLIYLFDKSQNYFSHLFKTYTRKRALFYQFLSLLDMHYEKERSVTFYADKLTITPRYLRKITVENTDFKSPKEIIDEHLIIEIKTLLYNTNLSVQEIAEKLNFPDQSYLSRFFKAHKGCSPSHYKNKIKALK
ncbi:MAG: AraC family transcriptional regulator [Labilibaculum sp.]|nr:AraC family transcriptional regulator [Labilibaculum sp.]